MVRESDVIGRIVADPTWKRIRRFLPEAAGADGNASVIYLLGLAATLLFAVLAQE